MENITLSSEFSDEQSLGSVHTSNFPELLRQLVGCLIVTTYQAGKLIILRSDGNVINTHFRQFNRPMGLAATHEKLAVGGYIEVAEFRNMPEVAKHFQNPPRHDAVYLARRGHITGAIDIHEIALDGQGEIWLVNTLFSCLCTLDPQASFTPRWRPKFITHYAREDRCHLNGLGMRDGKPRYLTALGESNAAQGWRANKSNGGILLDCLADEVIARGLSMPHSPRWYDARLWVLESGRGALVAIDLATGQKTDVARVPGFVRGLDFLGPIAFVGLSQLRDGSVFNGILAMNQNNERCCGLWAIDIRTGQTIALLKFTSGVQEIFAVQALSGVLFPEILHDSPLLASSYALPDQAWQETIANH